MIPARIQRRTRTHREKIGILLRWMLCFLGNESIRVNPLLSLSVSPSPYHSILALEAPWAFPHHTVAALLLSFLPLLLLSDTKATPPTSRESHPMARCLVLQGNPRITPVQEETLRHSFDRTLEAYLQTRAWEVHLPSNIWEAHHLNTV